MPETQPKTGNGICAPFPVDVFSSHPFLQRMCKWPLSLSPKARKYEKANQRNPPSWVHEGFGHYMLTITSARTFPSRKQTRVKPNSHRFPYLPKGMLLRLKNSKKGVWHGSTPSLPQRLNLMDAPHQPKASSIAWKLLSTYSHSVPGIDNCPQTSLPRRCMHVF